MVVTDAVVDCEVLTVIAALLDVVDARVEVDPDVVLAAAVDVAPSG